MLSENKSDFKEPVCECDPSQCGTWNNDYCTEAGDINAVNVCGACQCDQKQGKTGIRLSS